MEVNISNFKSWYK